MHRYREYDSLPRSRSAAAAEPAVALRRASIEIPGGTVDIVAPPASHDRQMRPLGPVPAAGQHTEAIKREFAS